MNKHILSISKAILCVALLLGRNWVSAQSAIIDNGAITIKNGVLTIGSGDVIKGNGNVVTREYEITGAFDEITTLLPATINYTVSDQYSCIVHVDENLLEYLDLHLNGDALHLGVGGDKYNNVSLRPTVFVIDLAAPQLERIGIVGSGSFSFLDAIDGEELEVNVIGCGDVVFEKEVNMAKMNLNLIGSGDISFEETARIDDLRLTLSGSGDLRCKQLISRKMRGAIAGSGDVRIADGDIEMMDAKVAGSGSFVSHADVDQMDAQVSGSGEITAKVNGELNYSITGSGGINYYGDPSVKGVMLDREKLRKIDPSKAGKTKRK
ncbi:MAG: DUF2807 domain-containing protein [Bacteroidales bacterium]|nr:DUF2807 domain-containing protein [Bacteroidales bacterium]